MMSETVVATVKVDFEDIVDYTANNEGTAKHLIMKIDESIADADFTIDLIGQLASALDDDLPGIGMAVEHSLLSFIGDNTYCRSSDCNEMKFDKSTMMVADWGNTNKVQFWASIKEFMHKAFPKDDIVTLANRWATECGLPDSQRVVQIHTIFPMRMMESLISSGLQLKKNE